MHPPPPLPPPNSLGPKSSAWKNPKMNLPKKKNAVNESFFEFVNHAALHSVENLLEVVVIKVLCSCYGSSF